MFNIKLLPQDKKFFLLLNELSDILVGITHEFNSFLKNYSTKDGHITRIHEFERSAGRVTGELLKELFSNFVTPLDREDIYSLTKILNGIIDRINGITKKFEAYNVKSVENSALSLSEVIMDCADEIKLLISNLNNMSAIDVFKPALNRLDALEEKGDDLYYGAMKDLFHSDNISTVDVIKWKDIYERLEKDIDKCNDIGHIVLGLILKYA